MTDKTEDKVTPMQTTDEFRGVNDIFPALQKYKSQHTLINLQKLCVEVAEFCRAIYASTQSDEERKVYKSMLEKLNK